jgi:tetratricopeptide (TPR) repeat protein
MSDWFRNTDWSAQIEEEFFRKLDRARSQKSQYLRIQASTLRERRPEVALALLDQYFGRGEHFDLAQGYLDQAHAYLALGNFEMAEKAYEKVLQREQDYPQLQTRAGFEFPLFVAVQKSSDQYERVLELIKTYESKIVFPVDRFENHAAHALISADLGRVEEARELALLAIAAAETMVSAFPRHPGIGLVGAQHDDLKNTLRALSSSGAVVN